VTATAKLIVGAILIVAIFLAGFVPQFMEKRRLQTELEDVRRDLNSAQLQIELDRTRNLAGRILLAASHQNYGIATTHAAEFFNRLQEMQGRTQNEPLKASLSTLLSTRDSITSGLAQGNPLIIPELQSLLERAYDLPLP